MVSDVHTREQVLRDLHLYTDHEDDITAVLANVAAVLKAHRSHYAWVGFYIFGREPYEMVLGPYQGPPHVHDAASHQRRDIWPCRP